MTKTRVEPLKTYWFVTSNATGTTFYADWERDIDTTANIKHFESGNYFHTKEEAESMARKLRAVLAGADVIEMPSEEEMLKARPTFPMEYDPWDAKNIREGFESCYEWLKEKIIK